MAPPPPPLMDELIGEILLRLPPDDIACLTRASLVCKSWCLLLSDPSFLRRYREIHGAAPLLGFLYNDYSSAKGPLFLGTTQPSPLPRPAATASTPTNCRTLDCRHGRVLLHIPGNYFDLQQPSSFTVWDPVTGNQQPISGREEHPLAAAVLCASHGCDHLDCSGGPFHVVVVWKTYCCLDDNGVRWFGPVARAQASLYSSETDKWSVSASIHLGYSVAATVSVLAGDALFFLVEAGRVLKYHLTSGLLSEILVPIHNVHDTILCTKEKDGGLVVASVDGCHLCLDSGRSNLDGIIEWEEARVIELDSVIPAGIEDRLTNKFCVLGFAEGTTGYIFIRANDTIFSLELKSGRITKIGPIPENWLHYHQFAIFGPIFPFMRFHIIPDLASRRLQLASSNED